MLRTPWRAKKRSSSSVVGPCWQPTFMLAATTGAGELGFAALPTLALPRTTAAESNALRFMRAC